MMRYGVKFGWHYREVVAPTEDEARLQVLAYIRREQICYNSCFVIERVFHSYTYSSKYTGEIVDVDKLYTVYTELYPNREMTFRKYLLTTYDETSMF